MAHYPKIPGIVKNDDLYIRLICCQKGFSLLETLVAFMVLSIVLVVVLQTFSGGIRSSHKSNQHMYATFHARAKMEELMATAVAPGHSQGSFDNGYQWQTEVSLLDSPDDGSMETGVVQMALSVRVSWRENGQSTGIELHSMKLVNSDD
jgi:general secretion pathway protein I